MLNMDDILKANIGDSSNTITVSFKKTVNIKQYESEVVEVALETHIPKGITSAERALLTGILQAQAEYSVLCQLAYKADQLPDTEFQRRRAELVNEVATLKAKAELILGRPVSDIISEHQ